MMAVGFAKAVSGALVGPTCPAKFTPGAKFSALEKKIKTDSEAWLVGRLALLPLRWSEHVRREHKKRGGLASVAANSFVTDVTEAGRGRLSLAASDDDLRAAAKDAAGEAAGIVAAGAQDGAFSHVGGRSVRQIGGASLQAGGFGKGAALELLRELCGRWGIEPAAVTCAGDAGPAIRRMCCARWWLRRLRRAHGRRCDGAAIVAGMVRRGLWVYSSQDAVERRAAQRRRNARAIERAVVECEASGESLDLADVVAASIANPEVKRAELMVRIKGCDAIATESGAACEFWTLTTPSRFHAQRIVNGVAVPNPAYGFIERDGQRVAVDCSPKAGQKYLTAVWARARAAWKRRGLEIYGLRTAEPHHDGCPHWHLIAYGDRVALRYARRLLRVYALRDMPDEAGAREYRFKALEAKAGTKGAAYAAKYVSKNIDGKGLEGDIDPEGQKKISASVKRVDAWAANWGIRQFQFFGCPAVTGWRILRRMRGPVAVAGSLLERARAAADDSDFAEYWRIARAGAFSLIYRAAERVTAYGDAAAARIVGIAEGARRAMLPEKVWQIRWSAKAGEAKREEDQRTYATGQRVETVQRVGAQGLGLKLGGVARRLAEQFKGEASGGPGGFGVPRSCVNNCTRPDFLPALVAG